MTEKEQLDALYQKTATARELEQQEIDGRFCNLVAKAFAERLKFDTTDRDTCRGDWSAGDFDEKGREGDLLWLHTPAVEAETGKDCGCDYEDDIAGCHETEVRLEFTDDKTGQTRIANVTAHFRVFVE